MPLKFNCRSCGKEIIVIDLKVGEVARCDSCKAFNVIPINASESYKSENDLTKSKTGSMSRELKQEFSTIKDLLKAVGIIWVFDLLLTTILTIFHEQKLLGKASALFITQTLDVLITIPVIWYFACKKYQKPFKQGFSIFKVSIKTIFASILIGFGIALFSNILFLFTKLRSAMQDAPITKLTSTPSGLIIVAFCAMIIAPFIEELYYRGFLFPILKRKLGAMKGIIYITIWFGLLHAWQLNGNPIAVLNITFVGFILTFLRHKSGSLIPSIVTHYTYNITLFLTGAIIGFIMIFSASDVNKSMSDKKIVNVFFNLSNILVEQGNCKKAKEGYEMILRRETRNYHAYNELAWLYVTCPDKSFRDPEEAIRLANIALEIKREPFILDTLACAYAEMGDFEKAIEIEKEAYELKPEEHFKEMIEAFKQKKTYIEYKIALNNK